MATHPSGTVAFLFTDIEGSAALWERDHEAMRRAVDRHLALIDEAVAASGGVRFKTIGDATQAAFQTVPAALQAAIAAQRALTVEPWPTEIGPLRVRMALHAGSARPENGDYLAPALNRLARTLAVGHGGQILVTAAARGLLSPELSPDVTVRSLGAHALRGLQEPEEVFQVIASGLPSRFPPLRSLPHHPSNLVAVPTPIIGRDEELARVTRMLRDREARLVTLTGTGGVGKSRLAHEVAAELLDAFPGGVFLVDLAVLRDPARVIPTIAETLGVHAVRSQDVSDALSAYLIDKSLLLILDSFEQVVDAASDVAALLAACPSIVVLATSREPLRIRAERELPVEPLPLPHGMDAMSLDALRHVPAIALFVTRAGASEPSFDLTEDNAAAIAEICRRLDGLPLAIELAAARIRLLPPAQLLSRLEKRLPLLTGGPRDLPQRLRTMRDAISWSYDLLRADEQALFRRLGVFAGGCTLPAVEWVAGCQGDPLTLMGALVEHSLVQRSDQDRDEPRYRLLDTTREYALEELEASGELEATRQRAAVHFLAFAEEAEPHLTGAEQQGWLSRLEADHDNLRAALAWALESGEVETGLRLATCLTTFWYMRGDSREARRWLEATDERARDRRSLMALRARALSDTAYHAAYSGDIAAAAAFAADGLTLAREAGDKPEIARALYRLATVASQSGEDDRAAANFAEALALYREIGDEHGIASALSSLGLVAIARQDLEQAAVYLDDALARFRALGERRWEATTLGNLGRLALEQGDLEQGLEYHNEAIALHRQLGHKRGVAIELDRLAEVKRHQGELPDARKHYLEALRLWRELNDPVDLAEWLKLFAALEADAEHPALAARYLGAAAVLRDTIGHAQAAAGELRDGESVQSARAALGEEAFRAHWDSGRSASLVELLAEAEESATGSGAPSDDLARATTNGPPANR
jgi:predicted ATPase/class 3 adenylate cyclase